MQNIAKTMVIAVMHRLREIPNESLLMLILWEAPRWDWLAAVIMREMRSCRKVHLRKPELSYDRDMAVPGVHSFLHRAAPLDEARERARQRLIVALDAPDAASAQAIVDRLEGRCAWFKVGLELFLTSR